jgi:two-component system chemotaxis response regulator CheV
MTNVQQEVDERSNLTSSNKFELLLFRLGGDLDGNQSELYGMNVFKIREIAAMPPLTSIAESHPHMLGVVNLRGQVIPVIDLPAVVGCNATKGLNILLITEFARTTQAFAVESVDEIVRLEWKDVLSAEGTSAGAYVTSIARIDGNVQDTRLAQVLDVETILRDMTPSKGPDVDPETIGPNLPLKPGAIILAADDSHVARTLIEQSLQALGAPYVMTKSGKEAWEKLLDISEQVKKEGVTLSDKVAMVLSDLEMPEMDGFTLTRNIKQDPRFQGLPVVIHSSLSGATNENHVKSVGADAYVAKFLAEDLAGTIRRVISKAPA